MTPPTTSHVARLLRADVPAFADDLFVATLADVARHAPATPLRRRVPLGAKVGAVAAAVAVTMFGAAYASDLFVPPPPTQLNPTQPVTDQPTGDEREDREPARPADPADHRRSPADGARPEETREDSGRGDDAPDSLGPAATEDEPPEASTDQPQPAGDPVPGSDEAGDGPDSENDSGDSEDEAADDTQDEPQDSSDEDAEDGSPGEDDPDEGSDTPEREDEADESSPDD